MPAVTTGTNRNQHTAPPAVEQPPRLRHMRAHREPEIRIRFLDISLWICETPQWRCREIHVIAEEGTVNETGPSTLFRGRYANPSQGQGPKKWLTTPFGAVTKPGYDRRQSPTLGGSGQPATPGRRILAATRFGAKFDPIGSSMASSAVALGIDERFGEVDRRRVCRIYRIGWGF